MIDFLKRKSQFVMMLLVWLASGMVATPVAIGVVTISVLLMKRRGMYPELIMGFIFILVLSDSWQPEVAFAKQVKEVYLVLLAAFYFFDRKEFRIKKNFIGPFIPFLVWASFQILKHPDIAISAQKTLSYALIFMVAPAYFIKIFQDTGKIFLKDYAMLISLVLMTGIMLYFVYPAKVIVGDRFSGVLGNPNAIGLFCTVFFILFQSTVLKFPDLFTKYEKYFVYALIVISVILSGSRNSLISIILFVFFSRFYKISPLLGTFIVIITAIVYQMIIANLPEILQSLGLAKALRADTLENGSGRLVAWTFAWKLINSTTSQFLFGRGFGFDEYIFIENYSMLVKLGHIGGVHNSYLALWLNTGIIGLLLWLVGFFRTIIRAIPFSYTALPITYAVMFSAFFEAWLMGSLNPYTITFLFILALISTNSVDFAEIITEDNTTTQKILSKPWLK